MCDQPSHELEILATIVHSIGWLVNCLGLVFNLRRWRGNWMDCLIHGSAGYYHGRSAWSHFQKARKRSRRSSR